jgi:Uma2 family endonuclease
MTPEMLLAALPDHLIGLDEWDAMPEDVCRRCELVEGVLHVSPSPTARHQRLAVLIVNALDGALPAGWCAVPAVDVLIEGGRTPTLRSPDVVVVPTATADHRTRQDPADVLAVVEVLSPGSRRTDRVAKLAEYAEVGIAHYLLVEPGPPVVLTELELVDGAYRLRAEHRGSATLALGAVVDLDALDR